MKIWMDQRARIARQEAKERVLQSACADALAQIDDRRSEGFDPCRREERWAYLSNLSRLLEQARDERRSLEDEAAVMEDRLRMAVRDRRVLENLKEKRRTAHRLAGRRREFARMDYLNTIRREPAT